MDLRGLEYMDRVAEVTGAPWTEFRRVPLRVVYGAHRTTQAEQ